MSEAKKGEKNYWLSDLVEIDEINFHRQKYFVFLKVNHALSIAFREKMSIAKGITIFVHALRYKLLYTFTSAKTPKELNTLIVVILLYWSMLAQVKFFAMRRSEYILSQTPVGCLIKIYLNLNIFAFTFILNPYKKITLAFGIPPFHFIYIEFFPE